MRCQDGSCRSALEDCPTHEVCPADAPFKCADRSCKMSVLMCPEVFDTDGDATTTPAAEMCEMDSFVMCPDGTCNLGSTCGTPTTCPLTLPFKCWDGTCRKVCPYSSS